MSPPADPAEARGLLVCLPSELLMHIVTLVDPPSLLDFAFTCKKVARCSIGVLRQHQQAHAQYRVISDLQPSTIPTLLRLVIRDPIVAWHVRSFEIWGSRSTWEDWRRIMMEPPNIFDPDEQPLQWSFEDEGRAETEEPFLHLSTVEG